MCRKRHVVDRDDDRAGGREGRGIGGRKQHVGSDPRRAPAAASTVPSACRPRQEACGRRRGTARARRGCGRRAASRAAGISGVRAHSVSSSEDTGRRPSGRPASSRASTAIFMAAAARERSPRPVGVERRRRHTPSQVYFAAWASPRELASWAASASSRPPSRRPALDVFWRHRRRRVARDFRQRPAIRDRRPARRTPSPRARAGRTLLRMTAAPASRACGRESVDPRRARNRGIRPGRPAAPFGARHQRRRHPSRASRHHQWRRVRATRRSARRRRAGRRCSFAARACRGRGWPRLGARPRAARRRAPSPARRASKR